MIHFAFRCLLCGFDQELAAIEQRLSKLQALIALFAPSEPQVDPSHPHSHPHPHPQDTLGCLADMIRTLPRYRRLIFGLLNDDHVRVHSPAERDRVHQVPSRTHISVMIFALNYVYVC